MKIICTEVEKDNLITLFNHIDICQNCPFIKLCTDKYHSCDEVLNDVIEWEVSDEKVKEDR